MSQHQHQKPKYSYDKFDEHRDDTPLGKLQQQYWTTKQHVIKKLGKKEDEFVVASDAELDSKLESFHSIAQSCEELLKIIDAYEDKLVTLSCEEAEMAHFLKSQSTFDTRTRAGKMMSAVAKGQHFSSQQRTTLRLPLVRLANEVDTFRSQAVKDTALTVRRMEQARTEYRGALLWMRAVSAELDPDAARNLEKFRRVQGQVKRTKARFDRLKCDVMQKIDLLSASRCNMFSHALVGYQQTLILFWQKTAKTMNAIADAYKGYQYYEFNIIKDLVEPSKKLAKMVNDNKESEDRKENEGADKNENSQEQTNNSSAENKSGESDEKLVDISDNAGQEKASSLTEFGEFVNDSNNGEKKNVEDELHELIDLMTMAEESRLNEQLRELEQLEAEKKLKMGGTLKSDAAATAAQQSAQVPSTASSLFASFLRKAETSPSANKQDLFDLMGGSTSAETTAEAVSTFRSTIQDLFSNVNDEFEREWQSVFQSSGKQSPPSQSEAATAATASTDDAAMLSPSQTAEFSLFSTGSVNQASLFAAMETASLSDKSEPAGSKKADAPPAKNVAAASAAAKPSNKQTWYDLFAELDPLKNPDAIGKSQNMEEERNC